MVNRRRFLEMLAAGAFGAMTLDVEKLLWVPGQKTIFVPQVTHNTILTEEWIIAESLRILQRDLVFGRTVARHYDVLGMQ